MFQRALLVAFAVVSLGILLPRIASADEQPIIGIVRAAAANAEEAATLKAGPVVYKIVKDDNGRTVAREANNKKVEMKGIVKNRREARWITVTSCKIVE